MAKDEDLVKDIDELNFDSKKDEKVEDLDDISEEELQEIEDVLGEKNVSKLKKKKKTNKKSENKEKIPKKETSKKKESKKLKKKDSKKKSKPKKDKKSEKKESTIKKPKKGKKQKSKKPKSKKRFLFFGIVLLVVLALALSVGFLTDYFTPTKTSTDKEVVALVNGEPITFEEFQFNYEQLSQTSMTALDKEDVLDALIEQELLSQKADDLEINVTLADAEEKLNELLQQRGMTREQLEQNLALMNSTIDDLLLNFKDMLIQEEVVDYVMTENNLSVSNSELINYMTDKVLVRHILISSEGENEEIYAGLKELKTELEEDDSAFCDLVKNISQDPGSLDNCGRYFFGKGEMVKEFENVAFNLSIGEFGIAKTNYGYHLIQRLSIDEKIREQAEQEVLNLKMGQVYSEFISDLKANADIEKFLDNFVSTDATEEDSGFEIIDSIDETTDESEDVVDEVTEEIVDESEEVVNETTDDVEEVVDNVEESADDTEEVIDESVEETTDDTEDVVDESEEVIDDVEETTEDIVYTKPEIDYYYSETDVNSAKITQLINDLETQDYINVNWKCIRVNLDDKELCIELYGEEAYNSAMSEAKSLNLKYAPTLFIEGEQYEGTYSVDDIRTTICNIAGC